MSSWSGDGTGHYTLISENGVTERWLASTLWEAAKGLPIATVAIADILYVVTETWVRNWHDPTDPTVRYEAERTRNVSLDFPVILHPMGCLMDGHHRVCRALQEGHTTIQAVCFTKDTLPEPDCTYCEKPLSMSSNNTRSR